MCPDLRRELQSKEDELEDTRAAANKKLKILEQQLEQVNYFCFTSRPIRSGGGKSPDYISAYNSWSISQ